MNVLLVEDDHDIRDIACMGLCTDPDMQVETACSGAEALIRLEKSCNRPDVILLDVMMPGIDGASTLKHIRTYPRLASIPVIFVTALARVSERERLVALGAAGVVVKPFDPLTLPRRVREIVGAAR